MECIEVRVKLPRYTFMCKTVEAMLFQFLIHARNFFSSPTKFVPLSDQRVLGLARRAMKLSMLNTQELVSSDGTTLRFTALVVRQVKRKAPFFSVLLQIETWSKLVNVCEGNRWLLITETFYR